MRGVHTNTRFHAVILFAILLSEKLFRFSKFEVTVSKLEICDHGMFSLCHSPSNDDGTEIVYNTQSPDTPNQSQRVKPKGKDALKLRDDDTFGFDVKKIFDPDDAGVVHQVTIPSAPLGIILESDSHGYNTNISEITAVKRQFYESAGIEKGMIISRLNNVNVLGLPFNIVKRKIMSR